MYEFEVQDIETGDVFFIWGYNFYDACARVDVDPDSIIVLYQEYVD